MMSLCRLHPDKMAQWALNEPFYTDAVYGWDDANTDTDDKISPNVIQIVPFYPNTDVR